MDCRKYLSYAFFVFQSGVAITLSIFFLALSPLVGPLRASLLVVAFFIATLMNKKQEFFERLFKARYHSVYSFFLKKLGSPEDAADASQETFMRMMRHNGTISLRSPDSYLFRIARNLVSDMLRIWAVRSKYTEAADIEAQPSSLPLQDAALDTRKQRELIQAAISELPSRCREVFVLNQFKNLTYKEIGSQLNISPNTVKNHYINALLKLRKALAGLRLP